MMTNGDKMDKPDAIHKTPFAVEVEKSKKYFWCACGLSKRQPFCDGAHQGTDMLPEVFTAEKTGTVFFCGCKHSKKTPFCDGSHVALTSEG